MYHLGQLILKGPHNLAYSVIPVQKVNTFISVFISVRCHRVRPKLFVLVIFLNS